MARLALRRVLVLVAGSTLAARAGVAQVDSRLADSARAAPVIAPRMVALAFDDTSHRAAPGTALTDGAAGIAKTSPRGARGSRHDWWAPVASAIVPGAGQARLQQDRFVGYLAVEGFLWARYLVDRRQGIEERKQYRDLALRVSRAPFAGPKPQGNFEYYEHMEHWIASGVYDADPGAAFVPESDTTTYNGAMWLLARRTYWQSPNAPPPTNSDAYVAAIVFYERYAVLSDFQWSWRDSPLHQDVYRRHIRASNDAFRRTITDVGAVIANHVLSTVDAYVSLRLRLHDAADPAERGVGISASVPIETLGSLARLARLRAPE